ncbi:MAG: hypothetical protein ABL998_17205 [Planctomycetota bacterium]
MGSLGPIVRVFVGRRSFGSWALALLAGCLLVLAACAPLRAKTDGAPVSATVAREPFELGRWRAGRGLAPALAATRRAELEAERARHLAALAADWSRSDEERLVKWLRAGSAPDELWQAAASVLAELELYPLARELLPALAPSAPPGRGWAARAALHRLYGHWFVHATEAEPYLASIAGGAGTRLLLASAASEEARSRERLFAALEHEHSGAAAWLSDPDPSLRAGAARLLARELTRSAGESSAALEQLLGALEREAEPAVFHEVLMACLAPLESAPPESSAARRLRALLLALTQAPADLCAPSVVDALTRLAWRTQGPHDEGHVLFVVAGLGRWLDSLRERDRLRGANDPDPLLSVLAGLHALSGRARAAGLGEELRGGAARDGVLAVFADVEQDPAVRAVAAGTLGVLARSEDALALARALGGTGQPLALEHAVLGALRELLGELPLAVEVRAEIVAAAARMTAADDADLRAQALALCADPRLASELAALDHTFLQRALAREEQAENACALLALLRRSGSEADLAALLSLESFERLAGSSAILPELVATLAALSAGAPRAVIRCATRLATGGAEATRLARVRHALALVAALDEMAALELQPREHRAVAAWVWQLERAGIAPRDATVQGLAFELRVLDVHLVRGEREPEAGGEALTPAERAHLVARLRADLFLGGVGHGTKPQVETAFESAFELTPLPQGYLVLRDRARFRAAANERLRALADYRRLFEAGAAAEPWLAIPDLRSAIELLGRLDETGGPGPSTSAGEACDLHARLIAREAWRSEPAAVRMQDLRDWVRTGLEARDPARLAGIEGMLASLPLTQVESQAPHEPVPLWFGLTREASWFQELLDLRARVRLALRQLEARG